MRANCRPWTPDEIAYLKESLGVRTAKEMAVDIGRTVCAIYAKTSKLYENGVQPTTNAEFKLSERKTKKTYGKDSLVKQVIGLFFPESSIFDIDGKTIVVIN